MSGISDLLLLVNSDMNEPLNYLHWINDLATFGEDGYVANDVEKLTELSAKSRNAINHKVARNYLLEGIIQSGLDVGSYFGLVTGDTTGAFDGLATIEDVANSATAMALVVNFAAAMTAVINSETAMTAIANSATAMTLVFGVGTPNYVGREMVWDNEVASEIIMTNSTSRAWLVSNAQLAVTEEVSTTYVLKVNKKCLVLAVERYGAENVNEPVSYRFIQPGNSVSTSLTTMSTRIENTRVYPLELRAGYKTSEYVNARVYYVQMQE